MSPDEPHGRWGIVMIAVLVSLSFWLGSFDDVLDRKVRCSQMINSCMHPCCAPGVSSNIQSGDLVDCD